MGFFIRTQLYNIRKSKRLMGTLLLAPALLLFCSYNAAASRLPPQYVLAMFAGLVSMLSSEILYWLTIDEIKDGIFDIILISSTSRLRVLIGKLFVPFIGGAGLALLSLLINNLLAAHFRFVYWNFSAGTVAFLLFGAAFFALLEFVTLLIMRRNNVNIHFLLLAGGAAAMLGAYHLLSNARAWLFAAGLLLLLALIAGIAMVLLKKRHQVMLRRCSYPLFHLYGEGNIPRGGAFFRKNIAAIRLHNHAIWQFVIAAAAPALVAAAAHFQAHFSVELMMAIAFSAIPAVANIHLIFYSTLHENRSNIDEIFRVQKLSPLYGIAEKACSAWLVSSALCTIGFMISRLLFASSYLVLLGTVCNGLIAAVICSAGSYRIRSFKSENLYKGVISLVSVSLQVLLIFLLNK